MKKNQEPVIFGNTLIVLGIVLGTERLIGYSFIGVGLLLSVISALMSRRKLGKSSTEVR
jgi:hypothetical protein